MLPTPDEEVSVFGGVWTQGLTQTLVAFKHDTRDAGIDETTVSEQYRGQFGKLRLDAEAAGQVGHRDVRKKLAGALDAIATVPVAARLSFSVQGSVASGGRNGDTTNTFDQLYPSAHDHHSLADLSAGRTFATSAHGSGSTRTS